MSMRCEVCGKQPSFGNTVSRLGKNATHRRIKGKAKRRWTPNIQVARVAAGGGTTKRLKVCASCIKAGKTTAGV